ncbi:MAG: hypothetical protein LUH15_05925 [Tannerellaceae bacterium]|nr:hypothetical protein [Tannerellaceae bacterium]
MDVKEDFHVSLMKPARLLFRPGKRLLQAAGEATYRRNTQHVVKDECPLLHVDD